MLGSVPFCAGGQSLFVLGSVPFCVGVGPFLSGASFKSYPYIIVLQYRVSDQMSEANAIWSNLHIKILL